MLRAAFSGLVAMAGAVTAIAAALYIVAPQLQPREKLGADVDKIGITQAVTLEEYGRATGLNYEDHADATMPGIQVMVHVTLTGFEDRAYSVSTAAYDPVDLVPVEPARIKAAPGSSAETLHSTCENKTPKAREAGVVWTCWLASPAPGKEFFVRAAVFDSGLLTDQRSGPVLPDDRELLDWLDSQVLTATG